MAVSGLPEHRDPLDRAGPPVPPVIRVHRDPQGLQGHLVTRVLKEPRVSPVTRVLPVLLDQQDLSDPRELQETPGHQALSDR